MNKSQVSFENNSDPANQTDRSKDIKLNQAFQQNKENLKLKLIQREINV